MKVNVGRVPDGKFPLDLSHPVSSTANFGFLQPASYVIECTAGDHFTAKIGNFVRLMPMNLPTFGGLSLRTFAGFVRTVDIWHAWESFQTAQPYNGISGQYVPTEAPHVRLEDLTIFWLSQCFCNIYTPTGLSSSDDKYTYTSLTPTASAGSVIDDFKNTHYYFSGFNKSLQIPGSTDPDYVTVENADFTYLYETGAGSKFLLCFKCSNASLLLFKIFKGIGWQPSMSLDPCNILPLVAYYKVWFDTFSPTRNMTWKQTNAFSLMEWIEQYGVGYLDTNNVRTKFVAFLNDLPKCNYTCPPDFVSSHINGTACTQVGDKINFLNSQTNQGSVSSTGTNIPSITAITSSAPLTQVKLRALEILSKIVNKDTAIGGKIDELMKVHGLGKAHNSNDSVCLGSSITDISISDIMANTAMKTDEINQVLGEYAGQGVGHKSVKETNSFTVNTDCAGYFVTMMAIVPDAKYCQMVLGTLHHVKKNDFYHREYEGFSLLPTRQNDILGEEIHHSDDFDIQTRDETGFGNTSMYAEYKHMPSLLNGNLGRAGMRDALSAYTLDKLLSSQEHRQVQQHFEVEMLPILSAGTQWRYIDSINQPWLGNFGRIFNNQGEAGNYETSEDNFIINSFVSIQGSTQRLPMSSSFDTDAFAKELVVTEKA